jgi:ATP/maltotriose-dependent transcriptional regulator MalT
MVEESLRHALAADDVDRAAGLLEKFREGALNTHNWLIIE